MESLPGGEEVGALLGHFGGKTIGGKTIGGGAAAQAPVNEFMG